MQEARHLERFHGEHFTERRAWELENARERERRAKCVKAKGPVRMMVAAIVKAFTRKRP